ncbi:hypothetical protein RCL_jg636.t1 [Rhizophagus clarus]|uniref:Uncharacterized protein n=1 Tax=Rhizophagus clarus TaxID=94130 RepID=A0A8H3LNQ4_9GLOM|nr:hypothetical protein RCL_jg636.t1 [Rhizophagus clarus]
MRWLKSQEEKNREHHNIYELESMLKERHPAESRTHTRVAKHSSGSSISETHKEVMESLGIWIKENCSYLNEVGYREWTNCFFRKTSFFDITNSLLKCRKCRIYLCDNLGKTSEHPYFDSWKPSNDEYKCRIYKSEGKKPQKKKKTYKMKETNRVFIGVFYT